MMDLDQLKQRIVDGEKAAAVALTRQAIDEGRPPADIFTLALFPAMDRVGQLMQERVYFLPEVLLSARAMQACSALLRPLVARKGAVKPVGKAVACTVAGDMHDIGKNLVCLMLEGAGFAIVDLGANCPSEKVVDAVREHRPDILAMSAMLTTTMLNMRAVIEGLKAAGLRDLVHVMVGGAPVSEKFAKEIGADFHSNQAAIASTYARGYMEARSA
jgi:corrinoid protein of di/trimethylamine methyltransferase